MQTQPLAYRARPTTLDEIIGQTHLVGPGAVLRKMVETNHYTSLILYGDSGIGKTTIAHVLGASFGLNTFTFNASTDSKANLKAVIEQARHYGALLIVDEIHRMKKDIQDYLLPHVESGLIIMIGLTTNNPYHSVNAAIRSRAHVYKLHPIPHDTLVGYLETLIARYSDEITATFSPEVLDYIARISNREIRAAINRLELLNHTFPGESIQLSQAEHILQKPSLTLDKDEDNYYNVLSAFQKSIRGSDVDASLHYLARLIAMEDLDSILRRLSVIAYEDVGLANPSVFTKTEAAAQACLRVGFPEARIILSALVIDLALSPKSNTACAAIDKALKDLEDGKMGKIPNHLINIENFEDKTPYLYPHSYPNHVVAQRYMPDELVGTRYYEGAETGQYEAALKARNKALKKILDSE
ncbi:MAG: replication-associated recombination protein A [Acholeplasmatales bacterium]|nr:MAG: replication-associated recombination protein A [Acholeplasmatales bacterium]